MLKINQSYSLVWKHLKKVTNHYYKILKPKNKDRIIFSSDGAILTRNKLLMPRNFFIKEKTTRVR